MNEEMINAIKEAKSAEELRATAKENEIELTEEQAKEYFDRFHTSGELADDELEAVAGGCRAYGHLTVTTGYKCDKWYRGGANLPKVDRFCGSCDHMIYNKGLYQCGIQ